MKILAFWRMSYQEKTIFFINFCLCGLAKMATQCLSYQRLVPYFGKSCQMLLASTLISKAQMVQVLSIRRNVHLAARYTPWDSNCLTQTMVAKFWCQHHKIPYLFFIGFPKQHHPLSGRNAHAWIMAGPIAITGGDCLDTHHILCSYTNAH